MLHIQREQIITSIVTIYSYIAIGYSGLIVIVTIVIEITTSCSNYSFL